MGIFDHLIDKNNKEPQKDKEYIYLTEMIWLDDEHCTQTIVPKHTIMINVVRKQNYSYSFECKTTGTKYRTNYGWSLAENTPENVENIEIFEKEEISFLEHKNKLDMFRKKIAKLL